MSVFPADRMSLGPSRCRLSFGVVLIALLGLPAHAQVGPPIKLIPVPEVQQRDSAVPSAPPTTGQVDEPAARTDPVSRTRSIEQGENVVVGRVASIDPSSVGLLTE